MTRSQPAPSRPAPRQDPRLYQIGVLAVLLLYGVGSSISTFLRPASD